MKNNIEIKDKNNGVEVNIQGDVKLEDVSKLTIDCNNGKCDCSPDMLKNISNINTNGKDGDVSILIQGNNKINSSSIQNCMTGCDCGF